MIFIGFLLMFLGFDLIFWLTGTEVKLSLIEAELCLLGIEFLVERLREKMDERE